MSNVIRKIPIDKLMPHPDNPNKMSKVTFAKLVRNIERTGRYEPLIVRPITKSINRLERKARREKFLENSAVTACSAVKESCCFQIINGHHRWLALKQLGHKTADAIVWDVDDGQANILLATLNRLCGQDVLDKKIALLKRLNEKMQPAEIAKLLPQTKAQLEKLIQLTTSDCRMSIENFKSQILNRKAKIFLNPLVFFVSDAQQQVIENALAFALQKDKSFIGDAPTSSAKRASALSAICRFYLDNNEQ